jgi:hypothetical protein
MTRVFETSQSNFADYTVCVVDLPAMADLLVYRDDTASSVAHGEQIWSFVDRRENAQFTVCIRPKGMTGGDFNIAFTSEKATAGWLRHHRLRGTLASPRQQRRKALANPARRQVYWGG